MFSLLRRGVASRARFDATARTALVPFGAAKFEEAEVCFLLAERVGVDAKRERRVRERLLIPASPAHTGVPLKDWLDFSVRIEL